MRPEVAAREEGTIPRLDEWLPIWESWPVSGSKDVQPPQPWETDWRHLECTHWVGAGHFRTGSRKHSVLMITFPPFPIGREKDKRTCTDACPLPELRCMLHGRYFPRAPCLR